MIQYSNYKKLYVESGVFTLTGSDYTGFVEVLSGVPYTSSNNLNDNRCLLNDTITTRSPLDKTSTFKSDLICSDFFTDRDILDANSLPFSLQEVLIEPNDFLNYELLKNKLGKLYANTTYTYSRCFVEDNNLPRSGDVKYAGCTNSYFDTLSIYTGYKDVIAFSSNDSFIELGKIKGFTVVNYLEDESKSVVFAYSDKSLISIVCEDDSTKVIEISPLYQTLSTENTLAFSNIGGITNTGNLLFISDSGNNTIIKYDISGYINGDIALGNRRNLIELLGGKGIARDNLLFNEPTLLTSNNKYVAVYDSKNYIIKIYDLDFNYVDRVGSISFRQEPLAAIEFNKTLDLLYIVTYYQNSIKIYILNSCFEIEETYTSTIKLREQEKVNNIEFSLNDSNYFYICTNFQTYKLLVNRPNIFIGRYNSNAIYTNVVESVLSGVAETFNVNTLSASILTTPNVIYTSDQITTSYETISSIYTRFVTVTGEALSGTTIIKILTSTRIDQTPYTLTTVITGISATKVPVITYNEVPRTVNTAISSTIKTTLTSTDVVMLSSNIQITSVILSSIGITNVVFLSSRRVSDSVVLSTIATTSVVMLSSLKTTNTLKLSTVATTNTVILSTGPTVVTTSLTSVKESTVLVPITRTTQVPQIIYTDIPYTVTSVNDLWNYINIDWDKSDFLWNTGLITNTTTYRREESTIYVTVTSIDYVNELRTTYEVILSTIYTPSLLTTYSVISIIEPVYEITYEPTYITTYTEVSVIVPVEIIDYEPNYVTTYSHISTYNQSYSTIYIPTYVTTYDIISTDIVTNEVSTVYDTVETTTYNSISTTTFTNIFTTLYHEISTLIYNPTTLETTVIVVSSTVIEVPELINTRIESTVIETGVPTIEYIYTPITTIIQTLTTVEHVRYVSTMFNDYFKGFRLTKQSNNYDKVFFITSGRIYYFNEPNDTTSVLKLDNFTNYNSNLTFKGSEYIQTSTLNKEFFKIIQNNLTLKNNIIGRFAGDYDSLNIFTYTDHNYNIDLSELYNENTDEYYIHENEKNLLGVFNRVISKIFDIQQGIISLTQPDRGTGIAPVYNSGSDEPSNVLIL